MKYIIFIFLLVQSIFFNLQKLSAQTLTKKTGYGIIFSGNYSNTKMQQKNWRQTNLKDSINNIKIKNEAGLGMGFTADVFIAKNWITRFKMVLDFTNTTLEYTFYNRKQLYNTQKIITTLPINVLYLIPTKKTAPYLTVGVAPQYNLSHKVTASINNNTQLQLREFNIATQLGLGTIVYNKKFNTSIELVYSSIIINELFGNRTIVQKTLRSINSNQLQLNIILSNPLFKRN
jgi:hypothetical protein